MKVGQDRFEITPEKSVEWQEVKTVRLLNNTLLFDLTSGSTLKFTDLHPAVVDKIFRTYETYIRNHPNRR